jgi:hypothetical protein
VSLSGLTFLVNEPVTVLEENMRRPRHMIDYLFHNSGPFTLPAGAEGIAFVKTNVTYNPPDYPDIELVKLIYFYSIFRFIKKFYLF